MKNLTVIMLTAVALLAGVVWLPAAEETKVPQDMYQLGPEDLVTVMVWKNEALSRTVAIRPDGWISLPLIGDVKAAGVSPMQLKGAIVDKLKDFVAEPNVTVIVDDIRSFKIYIIGEVARPGVYPLKSATTIVQALAMAGGFTQFASRGRIMVLRREADKEGGLRFNYNDIASGTDLSKNLLLKPGDTIIVP